MDSAPSKEQISFPLTLREQIVDAIRDAILKGELRPGSRISEPELATRFGISRTPIREALRQLDSEGFLALTPRKGARVASLSEQDVEEYYDLKSLLEGHAAFLATPQISPFQLGRMEFLNGQMELYFKRTQPEATVSIHQEFHDIIVKASGNQQLLDTLSALNRRFLRFTIQIAYLRRDDLAFTQHRNIIEAMRARDPVQAKSLVQANARLGKELMLQEVKKEDSVGD